jgi:hypothetical protein
MKYMMDPIEYPTNAYINGINAFVLPSSAMSKVDRDNFSVGKRGKGDAVQT